MKALQSIWSRTKIVTLSRIVVTMMAASGVFFTTAFLMIKNNTETVLSDWRTLSSNHANFENNPEFVQSAQAFESFIMETSNLIDWFIIAVLVAVAFFTLLMYFTLIGKIARPLAEMKDGIENITQTNDFSIELSTKHRDEVSQVLNSFNHLTKNLKETFEVTNNTLEQVANGQFSQQVEITAQGDLEKFKNNVNASIQSVAVTMNSLEEVINGISHGDFTVRMDERVQGSLKSKVDNAMFIMDQIIDDINRVMKQVTNCKFNDRVNVEADGRLQELKHYINQAMDGLETGLGAINLSIEDLSSKDLTHHIHGKFSGEIEILKDRLNHTAKQLNNTVSVVAVNAHTLDSEIANIATGNLELAQRTQTQAASIDQTATAMEQITATIQETAQNAADANAKTVNTQNLAQQGTEFMQQTVDSMQAIQEESMKISDIINLIDSIAFQTNLLALNAAVEAARAGEQGRGFAVVAGEVRNLAQQSADAAKQISNLINDVVNKVDIGASQINQTNEMFNEIHQGIRTVDSLVTSIAKSAKEQSTGMQQMNSAISDLDQGIRDNSLLVKETKTKSDNLVALSQELQAEVDTFKIKKQS